MDTHFDPESTPAKLPQSGGREEGAAASSPTPAISSKTNKIAMENLPLVAANGTLTGTEFTEIRSGLFVGKSIRPLPRAIDGTPSAKGDDAGNQQELLIIRNTKAQETYDPSTRMSTEGETWTLDPARGLYRLNGQLCDPTTIGKAKQLFSELIEIKAKEFPTLTEKELRAQKKELEKFAAKARETGYELQTRVRKEIRKSFEDKKQPVPAFFEGDPVKPAPPLVEEVSSDDEIAGDEVYGDESAFGDLDDYQPKLPE